MGHHARLSPSNTRWPKCPGSVREEAQYPDTSGEAAVDGTGSHLLLELCLLDRSELADYMLDQTIGEGHEDRPQGWWVRRDRINRVNDALAYINRRREELTLYVKEQINVTVEAETQANPGEFFGRNDWYGTCDVTLSNEDTLEVIDYKDGRGYVKPKGNTQLISYATGKLLKLAQEEKASNITTVRMTIVQPKTNPCVRYVEMTPDELLQEAKKLAEAADRTDDPDAPLIHGDHCTWCKHGRAGNCSAKTEESLKGLEVMSEHLEDGKGSFIEAIKSGELSAGSMTNEQLSSIKEVEKVVIKLIKQVDDEMFKRLEQDPDCVPGFTIGTGRKSKEWADDEEIVVKKLRAMRLKKDEVLIPTLISPAQALKHESLSERQKNNIEKMINVKEGKAKVVPKKEIDKKSAQDMFAAVPETKSIPDFM